MCFGCSKEPSHRDGSFEYPQHMFRLRNKKIIFIYALLSGGLHVANNTKKNIIFFCFRWQEERKGEWIGVVGKRIWKLKQTDEELLYHVCGRKSNLSVPDYCKTKLPASSGQKQKGNYIISLDRQQSKTLILSTNVEKKIIRNRVFDWHLSLDWQQRPIKNTVSRDLWSAFVDC